MSAGAWHTDPSGRHAQRYYDGKNWTEHVADASGVQSHDPHPVAVPSTPVVAGVGATAPPGPAAPPAQASAAPTPMAAAPPGSPSGGFSVTPGLIIAGAGLVAVILSQFALTWLESGFFSLDRSEIGELVDFLSASAGMFGEFGSDDAFTVVTELYFSVGWMLTIAAAVIALGTSVITQLKIPAALSCAAMAAWHLFVLVDISEGLDDLAIGSWVGFAGLLAGLVGALIARPVR